MLSDQVYLVVNGKNLFVNDIIMSYGSPVSIAYNQGIVQTVTGLQHVSYKAVNGSQLDYSYVFGKDAQENPYFGVIQLKPTSGFPVMSPPLFPAWRQDLFLNFRALTDTNGDLLVGCGTSSLPQHLRSSLRTTSHLTSQYMRSANVLHNWSIRSYKRQPLRRQSVLLHVQW